jgi:hypothetical protein
VSGTGGLIRGCARRAFAAWNATLAREDACGVDRALAQNTQRDIDIPDARPTAGIHRCHSDGHGAGHRIP